MRPLIEAELARQLDVKLVRELLEAHSDAKKNFYLGGLRLAEVEGGRFCEAAFRLLEQICFGSYTAIGRTIRTDILIDRLRNLPSGSQPDSIRLHIPRALRLVYDIRNNRDAAHLADGIDPNLQDATLVACTIDWVLAEFLRLYHSVSADRAKTLVDEIVTRNAPIVQEFDGHLKILDPTLGAGDHCLVLLYQRGDHGATAKELIAWARPKMRQNLKRTLTSLTDSKDLVHFDGTTYRITRLGQRDVEQRLLVRLNS